MTTVTSFRLCPLSESANRILVRKVPARCLSLTTCAKIQQMLDSPDQSILPRICLRRDQLTTTTVLLVPRRMIRESYLRQEKTVALQDLACHQLDRHRALDIRKVEDHHRLWAPTSEVTLSTSVTFLLPNMHRISTVLDLSIGSSLMTTRNIIQVGGDRRLHTMPLKTKRRRA